MFEIEGGRDLEAALLAFTKPMAKGVGRRALKKAADPILQGYRELTTVKTGQLLDSEIIGTKLNKRQSRMNKKLDSKSAVEVHIGTADPAGMMEEFGTINQPAHPALRPAWDVDGGQKAVDRIAGELWTDINKTAARVARKAARAGG